MAAAFIAESDAGTRLGVVRCFYLQPGGLANPSSGTTVKQVAALNFCKQEGHSSRSGFLFTEIAVCRSETGEGSRLEQACPYLPMERVESL